MIIVAEFASFQEFVFTYFWEIVKILFITHSSMVVQSPMLDRALLLSFRSFKFVSH